MTRLIHPRELLLLATAACVPLSLALTAWPPAIPQETIVVREIVPVAECCECVAEPEPEAVEEPEVVEVVEVVEEPEVVEATAPAGFRYGSDLLWVTARHGGAGPVAVLSVEPDEAWAAGPVQPVEADGVVVRSLDETALPAELRAMVGQRVDVYTAEGMTCSAVIGPPQLVAEADGDLDMMAWSEDDPDFDGESYYGRPEAERRAELAPVVWREGRRLLVAPLATDVGCGEDVGALRWARPQGRAVPVLQPGRARRPRASLAREFVARPELVEVSGELALYVENLRRMRADEAGTSAEGHEAGTDEGPSPPRLRDYLQAQRWRVGGEVAALTVLTEGQPFGFEGCGEGIAPRWGIASVGADGEAGAVHVGPYGFLLSVLDLEGDGQVEVLVSGAWDGTRLLTLTPEGLKEHSVLPAVPSFGCPC